MKYSCGDFILDAPKDKVKELLWEGDFEAILDISLISGLRNRLYVCEMCMDSTSHGIKQYCYRRGHKAVKELKCPVTLRELFYYQIGLHGAASGLNLSGMMSYDFGIHSKPPKDEDDREYKWIFNERKKIWYCRYSLHFYKVWDYYKKKYLKSRKPGGYWQKEWFEVKGND